MRSRSQAMAWRSGLAAKASDAPSPFVAEEAACVSALDHVVVRTPNPERAIAFYAGRLGLDLRLDRSNENGARGCCSSAAAIWWSRLRTI